MIAEIERHSSMRGCPSHRAYGLSCDQYDQLLARANDRCQICESDYALVIDHDHAVGAWAVRGILCAQCNATLYRNRDDKAQDYLADPWYANNPSHPVAPGVAGPSQRVIELYEQLHVLKRLFSSLKGLERKVIRSAAERVALDLLRANEMPTRVAARGPLSEAHLRKVARREGLEPARPGPKPQVLVRP